jgi:hypothetical protein
MSYGLSKEKIQQKILELNNNNTDGDWDEVVGWFWYTEATPTVPNGTPSSGIKLMPSGLPVKLFANKVTGELKTFPAKIFE